MTWMWLDLQELREEHSRPTGLRVELMEGEADMGLDNLPHYHREFAAAERSIIRFHPRQPVGWTSSCVEYPPQQRVGTDPHPQNYPEARPSLSTEGGADEKQGLGR